MDISRRIQYHYSLKLVPLKLEISTLTDSWIDFDSSNISSNNSWSVSIFSERFSDKVFISSRSEFSDDVAMLSVSRAFNNCEKISITKFRYLKKIKRQQTYAQIFWTIRYVVCKGQIISKGLFGILRFFQKTNVRIRF